MAFEVYFSTREIASRLDKAPRTVRRWVAAGQFGAGVVMVAGDVMVPESAIEAFLLQRRLNLSAEAQAERRALMSRRLGHAAPRAVCDGVAARSPGELRRKLGVQMSERERNGHE